MYDGQAGLVDVLLTEAEVVDHPYHSSVLVFLVVEDEVEVPFFGSQSGQLGSVDLAEVVVVFVLLLGSQSGQAASLDLAEVVVAFAEDDDLLGSHVPQSAASSVFLVVVVVVGFGAFGSHVPQSAADDDSGFLVVDAGAFGSQGAQDGSFLTGQPVADGPHEVTVTSSVAVTVHVSAVTMAARPAIASAYFIMILIFTNKKSAERTE